ncbi:MAG: Holliday junction resolvase RuvX [Gammaproteobacteria bacterium]|jgi:putative Holliday junction resolvase
MAFDYGTRRIGVAVGQTVSRTATPLIVLPVREGGQPQWAAVQRLIDEWRPDRLVVGMPETANGEPPSLKDPIERFANKLRGRTALPVDFVTEHLSSWAAGDAGLDRAGLDAGAATMILDTWFGQLTLTA